MGSKEKLADLLLKSGGDFVSGAYMAEQLGISRAAVWKNIKSLQEDGYSIEAVTKKGYRLAADNDVVSVETFAEALGKDAADFKVEVRDSLVSTNTVLKEAAADAPNWSVLAAGKQTGGRGRTGKTFFSPAGTGVYISLLLRENIPYADAGRLTTAAAVAACRAIEENTDAEPKIKWVNDVFVNGKKTCGILTEASVNYETGVPDWIVVGIGFNVYEPEEGFPKDIVGVAGAITKKREKNLRVRLAADFAKQFKAICADLYSPKIREEYSRRCFMLGGPIFVLKGEEKIPATALDIREDFALLVRYEDGREAVLNAGEVSVRKAEKK